MAFLYACGIVRGLPTCDVRVVWKEGWIGRRTQHWWVGRKRIANIRINKPSEYSKSANTQPHMCCLSTRRKSEVEKDLRAIHVLSNPTESSVNARTRIEILPSLGSFYTSDPQNTFRKTHNTLAIVRKTPQSYSPCWSTPVSSLPEDERSRTAYCPSPPPGAATEYKK